MGALSQVTDRVHPLVFCRQKEEVSRVPLRPTLTRNGPPYPLDDAERTADLRVGTPRLPDLWTVEGWTLPAVDALGCPVAPLRLARDPGPQGPATCCCEAIGGPSKTMTPTYFSS